MDKKEFYFLSSDGKTNIHAVEWTPTDVKHIKGVIQIAHGLNEHITMYESVAKFFTDRMFVVRGEDHIGHGLSIAKGEPPLYFGSKGSWHFASDDIYKLRMLTRKEYGETPYIMLGFSLGSYLVRDYLIRYNETIDAGILVGCIYNNKFEHFFGCLLANILAITKGEKSKSKLLEFITNGTSNMQIKNHKTPFDWLNENEEEIEKIKQDPYAYGDVTIGLFRELMFAVEFTTNKMNIKKMNKNIPILFIAGKDDPLACKGKTINIISKLFKEAGVKDVHTRLYRGRHRVLFEEEQENTLEDIYDWACSKLNTEGKNIEELFDEYDKYLDEAIKNNNNKNNLINDKLVYDNKVSNKVVFNKNDDNLVSKEKRKHKEFFLRSVKSDKAIMVTVEGSLTSMTAPKLVDYCNGLDVDLKTRIIVIDLQDIEYIAEPGEDALKKLQKKYNEKIRILK